MFVLGLCGWHVSNSADFGELCVQADGEPETEAAAQEQALADSGEQLYCVCQQPWNEDDENEMVGCDGCDGWFHPACVSTTFEEVRAPKRVRD